MLIEVKNRSEHVLNETPVEGSCVKMSKRSHLNCVIEKTSFWRNRIRAEIVRVVNLL
jgi:hypothetical protein